VCICTALPDVMRDVQRNEFMLTMYDEISSVYHLVYPDWNVAIQRQSRAYFDAATLALGAQPERILDVSCGIGTQALGLAALGCSVSASDLSAGAVARARREAKDRDLELELEVADMRDCFDVHGGNFDVLLSADNSVPHLAGHSQVTTAIRAMYKCLRPGGVVLMGVRDYKPDEDRSRGQVFTYGTRDHDGERYVVFQTRDWEGDTYEVGMYFVREESDTSPANVVCGRSRYYAISVGKLISLLQQAGFEEVKILDGVVHNVLLSGRKGA
jgi:SAM-dependent methyltransferase